MTKTFYENITSQYENKLIGNLKEFVRIPSVYSELTKDEKNPFGVEVSNALNYIADLAKKDGFKVTNYDNMIVEIIAGDENTRDVTIMAHADVVPEGEGWSNDPFEVVEKDKVFYGRGVADDKGPLLSAYYGLLALRENKLIDGYHVRFLVGGNEESGSLGMIHYFKDLKKKQPDLGFSPDSAYPLTYGEKGIIGFEATTKVNLPEVYSIDGGLAHNAVIEKCIVRMKQNNKFIEQLKKNKVQFAYEQKENELIVTFIGKSAHGSVPWLGVNAGLISLKELGEFFDNKELLHVYKCYSPSKGEGIKANAYSEDMFDNSLCAGFVKLHDQELYISVNFRYVNTVTEEDMMKNISEYSKPLDVKFTSTSPLLYYPKDSVLISTLMNAYQDETQDFSSKPLTSGGGTYAKEADNVVAFGMELPGWDSRMHAPDERVQRSNLIKSMAIYARAIHYLGNKLK